MARRKKDTTTQLNELEHDKRMVRKRLQACGHLQDYHQSRADHLAKQAKQMLDRLDELDRESAFLKGEESRCH